MQLITNLKLKKAWDTAFTPAKSIPMNAFMLYMTGNGIQIFSILVTVMMLFNSVNSMINVSKAFERFQISSGPKKTGLAALAALASDPLLLPMIAFVLMQAANLGLATWKCNSMGLLPTTSSDWLAFLESKQSGLSDSKTCGTQMPREWCSHLEVMTAES
eukprot:jgi/Hompol1/5421/HPOL_004422-RA